MTTTTTPIFRIRNHLLLKNLGIVYAHLWSVILSLQGAITAGGLVIAWLDDKPVGQCLYLAHITALTVGYGDQAPETGWSKVIAIAIGFLGIVFTGIVVAASLKAVEMTIHEQKREEGWER